MRTSAMAMACTASTSTTATVQGRHRFHIVGYNANKGAGPGHRISSGAFAVGGLDWAVSFYPDGVTVADMDYVSVYLHLNAGAPRARAFYDVRLVHPVTGEPHSMYRRAADEPPRVFSVAGNGGNASWGHPMFMRRRELEASGYVRDDRLTIECVVSVVMDPVLTAGAAAARPDTTAVDAPPSDILAHLAALLHDRESADVSFVVNGEEDDECAVTAHRAVLAMRSPVFRAELYGPMKAAGTRRVAVDGVEPEAFRALLHYIYTDEVLDLGLDDDGGGDEVQMAMHLLEAADRYGIERLKLICEGRLCRSLDADTVASMLAMAELHQCHRLKEACVEFMVTSKKMDSVLESEGYKEIKRNSPCFLVDLWETIGRKIACYTENLCKK